MWNFAWVEAPKCTSCNQDPAKLCQSCAEKQTAGCLSEHEAIAVLVEARRKSSAHAAYEVLKADGYFIGKV